MSDKEIIDRIEEMIFLNFKKEEFRNRIIDLLKLRSNKSELSLVNAHLEFEKRK